MAASVKVGDKVSWTSSGGKSTGKVVKKQTTPTKIKTHKVAASKDNPEYIVQSEKTRQESRSQGGCAEEGLSASGAQTRVAQKNACSPVCARPRMSAWTSCVPS